MFPILVCSTVLCLLCHILDDNTFFDFLLNVSILWKLLAALRHPDSSTSCSIWGSGLSCWNMRDLPRKIHWLDGSFVVLKPVYSFQYWWCLPRFSSCQFNGHWFTSKPSYPCSTDGDSWKSSWVPALISTTKSCPFLMQCFIKNLQILWISLWHHIL